MLMRLIMHQLPTPEFWYVGAINYTPTTDARVLTCWCYQLWTNYRRQSFNMLMRLIMNQLQTPVLMRLIMHQLQTPEFNMLMRLIMHQLQTPVF